MTRISLEVVVKEEEIRRKDGIDMILTKIMLISCLNWEILTERGLLNYNAEAGICQLMISLLLGTLYVIF
jgi:hypothetical protein